MWTFWLEFILVLGAILLGIRRGGVALGLIGGLGVAVLVFVFRTPPSEPPVTVMLIILAVVTASATLQVAGGLDWLVQQTERLLRAYPQRVTLLAPLATFLLTVCVGTGHAVYALLPVIGDVALRTGIRPERPMAISSVASQMGITASPVAAAVTTFLAFAAKTPTPVGLFDIVMITLPAGLAGVLVAALWSMKRGKDLADDPEYQARLADPQFRAALDVSVTTLGTELPKTAKLSVALFFGGVLTIVMLALFPVLVPVFGGKAVPMTTIV
ncbi:MAG TPA: anaerobic C4-dicarboxylate transporter family protein, partial [Plasticicumulans sp.]|nr:anaerobic C4-dicarboxylate transporter family protein [Plasticicumulans sp.]